jgi:carboxymethylenebutenolidase
MGELVEFPSNGSTGGGYLAPAHEGAGLGVVVIHDYSGLGDHIIDVCDRLSAEGFTALAPDLHHGEAADAGRALDLERAAKDLSGAIDFLQAHQSVRGHGVGVVGFGMGGGLAMWLATLRPDAVRAAVPFYGIAPQGTEPNWPAATAAVEGHYGEHDDLADPESVATFEKQLRDLGKDVRVFTYPGTGHAFFDDTRPEVYDDEAARQAWIRTLEFLRAQLG